MKIQCDVCSRDEASVFCCPDEAALCAACDHRVHHANKLAGKHRRLSLSSLPESHPLCDICKEKRGSIFCQEDRAILCTDCDASIHTANELTMKHSRFLLTGTRLSPKPLSSTSPPNDLVDKSHKTTTNLNSDSEKSEKTLKNKSIITEQSPVLISTNSSSSSSSISEYLIKMLPGYRVEDLLVDEANDVLFKSDELMPSLEPELGFPEDFPIWVPHVPQIQPQNLISNGVNSLVQFNQGFSVKEANRSHGSKGGRGRWSDDSFMVPQINAPVLNNNKRPRTSSSISFLFGTCSDIN